MCAVVCVRDVCAYVCIQAWRTINKLLTHFKEHFKFSKCFYIELAHVHTLTYTILRVFLLVYVLQRVQIT